MSQTTDLQVVNFKLASNANLKSGNDAEVGKELGDLFDEAQNGMRRIIALGLFAWEIKERQLKHGQFGTWLAVHCPKLATVDEKTGKGVSSRALRNYMDLTKSVLEKSGFKTINKYLKESDKFSDDKNLKHGGFLLIADKKVPDSVRPLREKICELVDGKTHHQLFMEFKQAEDEADKPKRGRLKGQGGATKLQRANAEQLAAQERITEKTLRSEEIADWLIEMSNDAGLGEIAGTPELIKLDKAMEGARGYLRHSGHTK